MCRMCMVLTCDEEGVLLSDIVTRPSRSIIRQSFCSQERAKLPPGQLPNLSYEQPYLNGDGYGVGWYTKGDSSPCVFTSTKPAWNDQNLENLAEKIRSSVVLAHVRAAGPGTPVGEVTCHPFRAGKFLWMHNGLLGEFEKTQRSLIGQLDERSFALCMKHSAIDSIVAFGLFLTKLAEKSEKNSGDPWAQTYPPTTILDTLGETVSEIIAANAQCKVASTSLLNFIVTDGRVVLASRVVDNPVQSDSDEDASSVASAQEDDDVDCSSNAASLYLSTGSVWTEKEKGMYHMQQTDRRNRTIIISSEPLSTARDEWMPVPANHIVMCRCTTSHIDVTFVQFPKKPKHVSSVIDLLQGQHDVPCQDGEQSEPLKAGLSTTFTSHGSPTTSLTSCRNGAFLISGTQDGSVTIWNLAISQATEPRRHPGPVLALLVDEAADRDLLFSSSHNELRIWNIGDVVCCAPDVPMGSMTCLSVLKFTPSNGLLLSLCGDAERLYLGFQSPQLLRLKLWEYRDELHKAKSRSKSIRFFTVDMTKVGGAKGGKFRPERLAEAVGTKEEQHNGFVYDMCLVGDELVTAGGDGRLLIWQDTKYVGSLVGHTGGVTSLARIGSHAISGSFDTTIREWDVQGRRCLRTLRHSNLSPVLNVQHCNGFVLSSFVADDKFDLSCWELPGEGKSTRRAVEGCGYLTTSASHMIIHVLAQTDSTMTIAVGGEKGGEVRIFDVKLPGKTNVAPSPLFFKDEVVGMLKEFVSFPSVWCNSTACHGAARWIMSQYESIGSTVITHTTDNSNPVVFARLGWNASLPTIVLYSHYDVVPAGEGWGLQNTPLSPWVLTGHDGYVYGRGVTDNKGPAVAQIQAVKKLLEKGDLNVNVLFICEGDEENMASGCLKAAIAKARQTGWLDGVVGAVVTNSTWMDNTHPCLCYGARGVVDMKVRVVGPEKELHTGTHGGLVAEPLHDLLGIIGNLVDPSGRVCVPDFYSGVKPPTGHDNESLLKAATVLDLEEMQASLGTPGFRGDSNKWMPTMEMRMMLLRQNWLQPSLCITSIDTPKSDTTATRRAIAYEAGASISVRTVSGQNSCNVATCLEKHLNHEFARRSSPNTLEITQLCDSPWWEGPVDSPIFTATYEAVKQTWGCDPLCVRDGGTMSVLHNIQEGLQVPVVQLPLGQSKDSAHLPNERIRVENLLRGVDVLKNLLENYPRSAT
eukprot:TRINITY_DN3569_c0_g1_i1.p1 TRINITY_DN3569_c0_g1~~TRINITY_DN3569_c0_g1_i1.p1  ORF type:complete len:1200 (+),score=238.80 TRINITY_DN3569_c0_g1_i1:18-3617(+)